MNLLKFDTQIKEVLNVARGELILENMLKTIKEFWNSYELELVRYQSKCKLIKGWDDLFAKVDEDLNNLSSMKISPYYKSFEEEIMPWDDKLQKVKILFDLFFLFFSLYLFLFAAVGSMSSAGGSISKASFSAPPISSSS